MISLIYEESVKEEKCVKETEKDFSTRIEHWKVLSTKERNIEGLAFQMLLNSQVKSIIVGIALGKRGECKQKFCESAYKLKLKNGYSMLKMS